MQKQTCYNNRFSIFRDIEKLQSLIKANNIRLKEPKHWSRDNDTAVPLVGVLVT